MQRVILAWAWNRIKRLFSRSTFYGHSFCVFSKILILIVVPWTRNTINSLIISSTSLKIWWLSSCLDHLISGIVCSRTRSWLIKFSIVSLLHRIFWSLTPYILSHFILSRADIVTFVQLIKSWWFRFLITSKRTLSGISKAIVPFLRV